jgi:phosphatidylglycerol:prolipoprotein diacylglycerol transferase
MHPEILKVPFFDFYIHSYGLMMVLGLLLGMELAKFLARRSGLNPDHFANAAVLALISGLVGARIVYVIQYSHEVFLPNRSFVENLWSAVNLTSGGLVYYGGFLLATAALIIYGFRKKLPIFRGMDIIAPCLMIGLAFGRIGCFLNGCCGGEVCALPPPVAVQFPFGSESYVNHYSEHRLEQPDPRLLWRDDRGRTHLLTREEAARNPELRELAAKEKSLPVINTQLISTVTALLIALTTFAFFTLYKTPGRGFALMLMLEGVSRSLIEGMRVEPTVLGPLTLSMLIGLGVAAGGVVLWFVAKRFENTPRLGDRPGYPATTSLNIPPPNPTPA